MGVSVPLEESQLTKEGYAQTRAYVQVRPILTEIRRDPNNSAALMKNIPQQTALCIKATLQKYLERELVE